MVKVRTILIRIRDDDVGIDRQRQQVCREQQAVKRGPQIVKLVPVVWDS